MVLSLGITNVYAEESDNVGIYTNQFVETLNGAKLDYNLNSYTILDISHDLDKFIEDARNVKSTEYAKITKSDNLENLTLQLNYTFSDYDKGLIYQFIDFEGKEYFYVKEVVNGVEVSPLIGSGEVAIEAGEGFYAKQYIPTTGVNNPYVFSTFTLPDLSGYNVDGGTAYIYSGFQGTSQWSDMGLQWSVRSIGSGWKPFWLHAETGLDKIKISDEEDNWSTADGGAGTALMGNNSYKPGTSMQMNIYSNYNGKSRLSLKGIAHRDSGGVDGNDIDTYLITVIDYVNTYNSPSASKLLATLTNEGTESQEKNIVTINNVKLNGSNKTLSSYDREWTVGSTVSPSGNSVTLSARNGK